MLLFFFSTKDNSWLFYCVFSDFSINSKNHGSEGVYRISSDYQNNSSTTIQSVVKNYQYFAFFFFYHPYSIALHNIFFIIKMHYYLLNYILLKIYVVLEHFLMNSINIMLYILCVSVSKINSTCKTILKIFTGNSPEVYYQNEN